MHRPHLRGRLLRHHPGFVEPIEALIRVGNVLIRVKILGVDALGLGRTGQGLFLLPDGLVAQCEIVARRRFAGIGLHPQFVDLDGLLDFPRDNVVVMRRDIELFAFAGSLLQVKRLGDITRGQPLLREIVIGHAECGVRHGEIRIEIDRPLQIGNRLRIFTLMVLGLAQAEGL